MVCWAPYGFASQVRAAHVLFRCPPGRDGAGPWSGGLGAAGAGDPDRPRLGGGAPLGTVALQALAEVNAVLLRVEHVELHLAPLLSPLPEHGGAAWGGRTRQGRHLSELLVTGCHRLAFGPVCGGTA